MANKRSSEKEYSKFVKSTTSLASKEFCKICFSGSSEASLISPCRCSGSIGYSHNECLLQWLIFSNRRRCELCKTRFRIKKIGYKPVRLWKMARIDCDEILHIILFICCILVMVSSLVWSGRLRYSTDAYSAFFREQSVTVLIYATYGPLNLLAMMLCTLEIKLIILPIITRWKKINQDVVVLPYNASKTRTKAQQVSTENFKKFVRGSRYFLEDFSSIEISSSQVYQDSKPTETLFRPKFLPEELSASCKLVKSLDDIKIFDKEDKKTKVAMRRFLSDNSLPSVHISQSGDLQNPATDATVHTHL